MELTHSKLNEIAVRWLKRSNSQKGYGCCVAVSECKSGWDGEVPDAFGVRTTGWRDGSIVVEVKVSRSDFLADSKKPHRRDPSKGLGNWRYFMCPEDLISVEELPPKWGLLYVNKRGHVIHKYSPWSETKDLSGREWDEVNSFESDKDREIFLLSKLFSRVGDANSLNNKIKYLSNENSRLSSQLQKTRESMKTERLELMNYRLKDQNMTNNK